MVTLLTIMYLSHNCAKQFPENFNLKFYCTEVPLFDNPHVFICMCDAYVTVDNNLENGLKASYQLLSGNCIHTIAFKMRFEDTGYPSNPNPMSGMIPEELCTVMRCIVSNFLSPVCVSSLCVQSAFYIRPMQSKEIAKRLTFSYFFTSSLMLTFQ